MSNFITRPWRRAFSFRGRATRLEYWFFLVQLVAAYFGAMAVMGAFLGAFVVVFPHFAFQASEIAVPVLAYGGFFVGIVPYLSASVRRLHDHDKSGWMYLLTMIPLVGWIFYLIMMLTPGTPGENSHGPDPRDRDEEVRASMSEVFR
ncbi:MAG TPA: DUF805 domain-containing protein [Allosphingosinicella sp.]